MKDLRYTTRSYESERTSYASIRTKFNEYFEPHKNVVYEQYLFWNTNQQLIQTIDNYVTELRLKATSCEFGPQEESMIRDRIVISCPDYRLQERLLRETDLTLAKALVICRAAEATKGQSVRMKNGSTNSRSSVHAVAKKTKQFVTNTRSS